MSNSDIEWYTSPSVGDPAEDMDYSDNIIDLSAGDPIFPFQKAGEEAFKKASENLHMYTTSDLKKFIAKPVSEILDNIMPYLIQRGFVDKGEEKSAKFQSLITGGGTSEGFEFILRMLTRDVAQARRKTGKTIKPVMIMPAPTYGFFIDMAVLWGFRVVFVHRDLSAGGALDPERLKLAIEKVHEKGARVVAYFDSNPNNPTGLVRGEKETREIGKILTAQSDLYQEQDRKDGAEWDGPAARICLIDDMVYDGSQYESAAQACSFRQIKECREDTMLLLGLSKIGLARLRAGFVLGARSKIELLWDIQRRSTYFASGAGLHGLETFMSVEPEYASWRQDHLLRSARAHKRAAQFMKAFIDGMDSVAGLTDVQKEDFVTTLSDYLKITPQEALEKLQNGLDGIKVLTTPEAGFFHLLDFSGVKNKILKIIKSEDKNNTVTKTYKIEESEDILVHALQEEYDLLMLKGVWMGLKEGSFIFRTTFAMKDDMLLDALCRLDRFAACLID